MCVCGICVCVYSVYVCGMWVCVLCVFVVYVLWICVFVCSVCACCVFMFVVCKDMYVNGVLFLYVTVYMFVVCVYFYCIQWAYGYTCPCVYMQSTEEDPMCFPLLLLSWLPWNEPKPEPKLQMCRQWTLRICLSKDKMLGLQTFAAMVYFLCCAEDLKSCLLDCTSIFTHWTIFPELVLLISHWNFMKMRFHLQIQSHLRSMNIVSGRS